MAKKTKKKRHITRRLIILVILLVLIFLALCLITRGESEMKLSAAGGEIEGLELPAPVEGEQIIEHLGYTLSYNEEAEQPSWVAYELTRDEVLADNAERTTSGKTRLSGQAPPHLRTTKAPATTEDTWLRLPTSSGLRRR